MTIRNKLILYTFLSTFITLIIVGFSINNIITSLYNKNAATELDHSYTNFLHELSAIENKILNQTLQIATDSSVIATSNMINRYQNINDYQPLIFNNDKKKIASYLLKQISLTKSEQAIVYNKNGELIAYAIHNNKANKAGFISYKSGQPINTMLTSNNSWEESPLPKTINLQTNPLKDEMPFLTYSGKIEYFSKDKKFIVENSRIIYRNRTNNKSSLLGVVKVNKSLDDKFFIDSSADGHAKISLLLHSGHVINSAKNLLPLNNLEKDSKFHGDTSTIDKIKTHNSYYIQSYMWPTKEGNNYILTTSSRTELITALNKTRTALIIVFVIIAALSIIFGVFWLNRLISKPLNALTFQATQQNLNLSPHFLLGKVLNDMVISIQNREKRLIENEIQLNHTQRLAKIGGWKIDHTNGQVYFSDEIFSILELDKNKHIASTDLITSHMHPDDLDMITTAYNDSMKNHTPYDITHRLVIDNGDIKTVHVYSVTIFNNTGVPLTTKGTIQDITDQVSKDEQLRRSQKLDAIGNLTGGIAHDFNNMLGVILGFTELLQEGSDLNENNKEYLEQIAAAGQRASNLTSKLLAFSRKDNIEAISIDLNETLLDEKIMLEKTLTVRIKLELKLCDDIWTIWLNKGDLEDAIVNMSINAMHAMPDGGNLILATQNCTLTDADITNLDIPSGDYVILSITDNGIGMSQQTLRNVFEPFFTTKKEMGTGLGMSQVYGFVKRSHGCIKIDSQLEYGTCITIYFPRYIECESTSELLPQDDPNVNLTVTGNATILIVDDEPALIALTKEILTSNGYNVLTAESGLQALEILKNNTVDLVLSDVIMPDMDGYQLANKIKNIYPNIKIQMASGFSDVEDSESPNDALHNDRLQKPYKTSALLKKIYTLLTVE